MPPVRPTVIALLTAAMLLAGCGDETVDNADGAVSGQAAAFARGDFSSCDVCHGAKLQGNQATGAPALTHLPAWYIRRQLTAFAKGWRGKAEGDVTGYGMHATAALLNGETVDGAIRYILSKPAPKVQQSALIAAASFQRHCVDCHGTQGTGDEAQGAPPLAGFSDWYLAQQVQNFAAAKRGYHQDDISGQKMRMAIEGLPGTADLKVFGLAE